MDYKDLLIEKSAFLAQSPMSHYFPKAYQLDTGRTEELEGGSFEPILENILVSSYPYSISDKSLDIVRTSTHFNGGKRETFEVIYKIHSPSAKKGFRTYPLDWKEYVINPDTGAGDAMYLRGKLCEQIMRISLSEQFRRFEESNSYLKYIHWKGPRGKNIKQNRDYTMSFDHKNAILIENHNSERPTEAEYDAGYHYRNIIKLKKDAQMEGVVIGEAKTGKIGHLGCHSEDAIKETYDQFIAPNRSLTPNAYLHFLLFAPKGQLFEDRAKVSGRIGQIKNQYHDLAKYLLQQDVGFIAMESTFPVDQLTGISKSLLHCREIIQDDSTKPQKNNAKISYAPNGQRVIQVGETIHEVLGPKGEIVYRDPKMKLTLESQPTNWDILKSLFRRK